MLAAEQTLDLLDGTHAVIRDPKMVPEGKRSPVVDAAFRAMPYQRELAEMQVMIAAGQGDRVPMPADAGGLLTALQDIIRLSILALVKSWDYGPVTLDVLLNEVPGAVYDQLRDVCLPKFQDIVPNFSADANVIGTRPDGTPVIDPAGPTEP